MFGWIIVGLFVGGVFITGYSMYQSEHQDAPDDVRMGWLFPATIGLAMLALSILVALVVGIAHLF